MDGRNRTTATRPPAHRGWRDTRWCGYEGLQGLSYSAGICAESAGARGLCLHTLVIPAATPRLTSMPSTSRRSTSQESVVALPHLDDVPEMS
jgi:hypothetical protein